jgi:hypothetical protein
MTRGTQQIHLRIPPDLKDQLEVEAKGAGRSLNAEIVARLEASFRASAGQGGISPVNERFLADILENLASAIEKGPGSKVVLNVLSVHEAGDPALAAFVKEEE